MSFLCSQCGACCRNVAHLDLPSDKDGGCLNLDKETNKCSIYENRPDICRVDKMYEKFDIATKDQSEVHLFSGLEDDRPNIPAGDVRGSGATATTTITDGVVTAITVTAGGINFVAQPVERVIDGIITIRPEVTAI